MYPVPESPVIGDGDEWEANWGQSALVRQLTDRTINERTPGLLVRLRSPSRAKSRDRPESLHVLIREGNFN